MRMGRISSAHTQTHARAQTHTHTYTHTHTHKQVRSCYTIEQQVALTLHLQPLNTPQKKKSQLNTLQKQKKKRLMNVLRSVSHVFLNNALLRKMKMKIGTHNGTFHCDEVLACFLLRQLPEYKVLFTQRQQHLHMCSVSVAEL